jgi:hypothetical protein
MTRSEVERRCPRNETRSDNPRETGTAYTDKSNSCFIFLMHTKLRFTAANFTGGLTPNLTCLWACTNLYKHNSNASLILKPKAQTGRKCLAHTYWPSSYFYYFATSFNYCQLTTINIEHMLFNWSTNKLIGKGIELGSTGKSMNVVGSW